MAFRALKISLWVALAFSVYLALRPGDQVEALEGIMQVNVIAKGYLEALLVTLLANGRKRQMQSRVATIAYETVQMILPMVVFASSCL